MAGVLLFLIIGQGRKTFGMITQIKNETRFKKEWVMEIQKNVSLADKNWFKTGGAAQFYSEPTTDAEFVAGVLYAKQHNLDVFVLGLGANILISDDGFDGLVIRPRLTDISYDVAAGLVTAGAGVAMADLINGCLDHGLTGLEEFSGIPGTVGGSIYINIHYFEHFLGNFLVGARVLEVATGRLMDVERSWFTFGYDDSILQKKEYFLVNATFKLTSVDQVAAAYAKGRRDETIRHRNFRYPRSNTCGSFFRNFLMQEVPFLIKGKKLPYVAYYLDKIGIKGELTVGGAAVSHQHANMLVTNSGASSADVIALARQMQELVYKQFGIIPQAECQLVGFKEYPLYTSELVVKDFAPVVGEQVDHKM